MGIKERRTKILIGLFLLSDLPIGQPTWNFSYLKLDDRVQKILDITLNQKTKSTLTNLIKDGHLEVREGVDGQEYGLTDKGFAQLIVEWPCFRFWKEDWDKRWRILSYEIPEKKRDIRDRLRREVAGWGLGPWHRSFWITPHPIIPHLRELINDREEKEYIQAFESEHSFGDREVLIEKVWGKSQLESLYRTLFKKWHEFLSADADKTKKFKDVLREYLNVLRDDPGLPRDLIGEDWIGFEAVNIFKEIRSILLS